MYTSFIRLHLLKNNGPKQKSMSLNKKEWLRMKDKQVNF